ncbi:hypothetical protein [Dactylosporangium sp. NPDC000521]|uniref:hypothetical protein n=1 Tax=Dactylosporangium sp. NPDC000521 TaxID=3363975 RepID=UPI0036783811
MGALPAFAFLVPVACAAIWATARVVLVLIVLRGTKPRERPELLRAMSHLSHPPALSRRRPRPAGGAARRGR